jgi:hypothetical protein
MNERVIKKCSPEKREKKSIETIVDTSLVEKLAVKVKVSFFFFPPPRIYQPNSINQEDEEEEIIFMVLNSTEIHMLSPSIVTLD